MPETVTLCAADEVVEGEIKQAPLPDGSNVALYRVDGAIYATADMCTHGEASLADEGIISGKIVECTFHFGTFDVTTLSVALRQLRNLVLASAPTGDGQAAR